MVVMAAAMVVAWRYDCRCWNVVFVVVITYHLPVRVRGFALDGVLMRPRTGREVFQRPSASASALSKNVLAGEGWRRGGVFPVSRCSRWSSVDVCFGICGYENVPLAAATIRWSQGIGFDCSMRGPWDVDLVAEAVVTLRIPFAPFSRIPVRFWNNARTFD